MGEVSRVELDAGAEKIERTSSSASACVDCKVVVDMAGEPGKGSIGELSELEVKEEAIDGREGWNNPEA